jgi:secondary thiamine-phosphate synthase enzyme
MIIQRQIELSPRKRGFHIITGEVIKHLPELPQVKVGLLNIFIQHSSASLSINENADPSVREDMEKHINVMVPENAPYYKHIYEGEDDMPAHIKASLIGSSVSIPIKDGKLLLGVWQGIYLGEHRIKGGARTIIMSIIQ